MERAELKGGKKTLKGKEINTGRELQGGTRKIKKKRKN